MKLFFFKYRKRYLQSKKERGNKKNQMASYSRKRLSESNGSERTKELNDLLHHYNKHMTDDNRKLKKNITKRFKSFPQRVFDTICENISICDTISLSLTCSTIKRKVESNIYKHLRIIDIDHLIDEDELIIQKHFGSFKDESLENETWWVYNNVTDITTAENVLHLVYNVLTNPANGEYIKTIEINPNLKPSPWVRCRNDESNKDSTIWLKTLDNFLSPEEFIFIKERFNFFDSSMTLFDCLSLLLDYTPNLENLIVSRFSLPYVSRLMLKTPNLKQLKIMIHENDEFIELPLNSLTKLKILRLKFQENTENILEKIAVNFKNSGILPNLQVLKLKYDKTDFNHLSNPTWFSFFKPLIESSNAVVFKNLKKFELKDCFFGSNQNQYVSTLCNMIPFHQIEWLSLQIYEYSHKSLKHSACHSDNSLNCFNTTLSYLSPHLANIKDLTIKPTKNCKDCQFSSILNFLNAHRNLENIWISTDSLNKVNYKKLMNVLHNYKNLKKIAYFDEFINIKLINNLKNWFIFEHGIMNFDIFKNYESEVFRQDIDPLFECYRIDEFKKFNEKETNLLVLFWRYFLKEFELDFLMNKGDRGALELKLFGYNFKVDKHRKVIMLYISKDKGYVDLVYYT